MSSSEPNDYLLNLWQRGQDHLIAGRYSAARAQLEHAESIAWRNRDARSLARIYLPLLEVRRLMRYLAAEGLLLTADRASTDFLNASAGTLFLTAPLHQSLAVARRVQFAARRTGRALEALLLQHRGAALRLLSPGDPHLAAGISVRFTTNPADQIGASTEENLTLPLPRPARYDSGPLHALARESIVIAWEALALKWQRRHAPMHSSGKAGAWAEVAWLRRALGVDPACEPISMRLIAVAEAIERMPP